MAAGGGTVAGSKPLHIPMDAFPFLGHAGRFHRLAISPSSDSLRYSLFVLPNFPVGEGSFLGVGTFPVPYIFPQGWRAHPASSSSSLLSFVLWLQKDLSYPFWFPRSPTSVQLVLFENCSIFRYTLITYVKRNKLYILLFFWNYEISQ